MPGKAKAALWRFGMLCYTFKLYLFFPFVFNYIQVPGTIMILRLRYYLLILIAVLLCRNKSSNLFAGAYQMGDVVDTAVSTRSKISIDLLMGNQPKFGIRKISHLPRLPERFSLSFEEGLHTLPYFDGQSLEQLFVTFIYTKSGQGRIESVTSKAIHSKQQKFDKNRQIEVIFDWVEEESVDVVAGLTFLFLVSFIVSILFLLQLCIIGEGDENDEDDNENNIDNYYKGR